MILELKTYTLSDIAVIAGEVAFETEPIPGLLVYSYICGNGELVSTDQRIVNRARHE